MKAVGDNLIFAAKSGSYTAEQFRALFLYAIGEGDAPADCAETAELIANDQRLLAERMERKRTANAERQARHRERAKAAQAAQAEAANDADVLDFTRTADGAEMRISVGVKPPTLERVLAWVRDEVHNTKKVPEDFARKFFEEMETSTPPWTTLNGGRITNWTRYLGIAWENAQKRAKRVPAMPAQKTNQPVGVVHYEDGYEIKL